MKKFGALDNKVTVSSKVVFEVDRGFTPKNNAGKFIDSLIQLCSNPPEYLHPRDAARYLFLLPLLKASTPYCLKKPVADSTIGELCDSRSALEIWIKSYYQPAHRGEVHPLLPHFALDAAEFLLACANGHSDFVKVGDEFRSWSVKAMVRDLALVHGDFGHFGMEFKRGFSTSCSHRSKGVVPLGASIKWRTWSRETQKEGEQELLPGDGFQFYITRCFLSDGWTDYVHADVCKETKASSLDMRKDFEFHGKLSAAGYSDVNSSIPGRWIVASTNFKGDEILPLPWEKE